MSFRSSSSSYSEGRSRNGMMLGYVLNKIRIILIVVCGLTQPFDFNSTR